MTLQIDLQHLHVIRSISQIISIKELPNQYVESLQLEVEFSQIKIPSVVLHPKRTPLSQYWKTCVSIIEKNIENGVRAKTAPCLTSLSIGISSDNLPLMTTLGFIPLCKCLGIFTDISGHPIFPCIVQNVSLLTISKTLIKSTKTW